MFPGVGTSASGIPCSSVVPQHLNVSGDGSQGQYSYMVNTLGLVPSSVALYAGNNDRNASQSPYSPDMSRTAAAFIPYGMPAIDSSILPDTTTTTKPKKGSGKYRSTFSGMMKLNPHGEDNDVEAFSSLRKTKKCDICGDVLSESDVNSSGNKKGMCEVCRKFLMRMQALEQMKQGAVESKKLHCATCQKGYASLTTLKTHMRVHIGTKCFKCTYCDRNFLYEGNLRTHIRVHTGEKPYTCEHCGKSFNQSGTLKKHIRIHTGEKPYKCDICDKAFAYSENLIPHKRVHSQDRPFSCHLCDKAYTQPGSLKSHLKVVHRLPNNTSSNNEAGVMVHRLEDDMSGDSHVMPDSHIMPDSHVIPVVDRSEEDEVVTSLQHIVG